MKAKHIVFLVSFFTSIAGISQTFSGVVLDFKTKTPIESASIYFDNTTIGTTTNVNGEFSIIYSEAIKSGLVISYLGYESKTILDYRQKKNQTVYLRPQNNVLDEVVINADDGLTRRQKLRIFRKEFLGQSKFGRSCKILNEDALILRYNKKEKRLTTSAIEPLVIENRLLQYVIQFDIQSFIIKFNYVETKNNIFNIKSLVYTGNTFYKNLESFKEKRVEKNRQKAYDGSVMQFMRALYNKDLQTNDYQIFYKRFKTNPWDHFEVQPILNESTKRVLLDKPVSILHNNKNQSRITFLKPFIIIDKYGNYFDITRVLFSGYMGNQRVGDLLPIDYGL
ncbi:carboxypeptidase-like regulatory domain-containing protein [Algibacter aquimarinus]|uniref:Carboxypeptidase-like regulatory domain-containing protein n=1 Tax=Algibacter aquimarinus TaxID=1136748 RepID=A0ABP9HKU8_9FLAO